MTDRVIFICQHPARKRRRYGDLELCWSCMDRRRGNGLWCPTVRLHEPDGPMYALDGHLVAFHWRQRKSFPEW